MDGVLGQGSKRVVVHGTGHRWLAEGIATGRARFITPASLCSPTILKSQIRQAKDSVYIAMPDGRYLFPNLELLQHLNGIPAHFDFQSVAGEQCAEQIGQSIDFPLHEAICRAVHAHIAANVGKHTVLSFARTVSKAAKPTSAQSPQRTLFG